jgi:hypothetical protein
MVLLLVEPLSPLGLDISDGGVLDWANAAGPSIGKGTSGSNEDT